MRELTQSEMIEVNGGLNNIDWINYAGDALTIGGGILAGIAYTASGAWVVTGAVIGAYYAGQAIGEYFFVAK